MQRQASNDSCSEPLDQMQKTQKQVKRPTEEYVTSQAERAAMHPDRSDLEWGYYHAAWSH